MYKLGFPFNFINGAPARFDTLLEALLYKSSPTIPRFHLIAINFPAGSASHVARNTILLGCERDGLPQQAIQPTGFAIPILPGTGSVVRIQILQILALFELILQFLPGPVPRSIG